MTDSAASVLNGLTAKSLFDLKGVVAVVTGGSSVSQWLIRINGIFLMLTVLL
jgi:hypothetical protein